MLCKNTPRYALFWIRDLLNQFVEISLTSRTTISGWSCCHWYSFIFQRLSTIVAWIVGVFNLITSIVMLNLITPLSPTIHAKMLGCANREMVMSTGKGNFELSGEWFWKNIKHSGWLFFRGDSSCCFGVNESMFQTRFKIGCNRYIKKKKKKKQTR